MMKWMVLVISLLLTTWVSGHSSSIQLHELYEPAPVTFRLETPGWIILAGIILMIILLVAVRQIRKYINNRYRREALQKLENLDNAAEVFPQLLVVLKKTAIHTFGRDKVGHLYGMEWLSFLEKTGKDVRMTDYHDQVMNTVYAGKEMEQDAHEAILLNAKKWIRTHAG
jgi:hypothetical protein